MKLYFVFLSAILFFSFSTFAENPSSGITPSKRSIEYSWMSIATWEKMHAEDVLTAQYDQVDLLFLGDSITAGWNGDVWQKNFTPLKAANFGIGGDHTGNVLWRLQHGDIGNIQPKLVVLLIGVNNFGHLNETPEQVAAGVLKVVQQIQLAWPNSKILLNAIFPYEQSATSPKRKEVIQVNKLIAKLGNHKNIIFKDYGYLFLQKDGSISKDILGDFLHPTAKGYEIWANVMTPDIVELMDH